LHIQFKKDKNARQAMEIVNKLLALIASRSTANNWFKQWKKNTGARLARYRRPPVIDKRVLGQKLRGRADLSTSELSEGVCSKWTDMHYLHSIKKKPKRTSWLPHRLSPKKKQSRSSKNLSGTSPPATQLFSEQPGHLR
jgi:hypothetical protein